MKSKFVDTNIFLEALVRKGKRSEASLKLLETANNLWTTELVITEIEWVMRTVYQFAKADIVISLQKILSLASLVIFNRSELTEAVEIFSMANVDFTDCLNFILAKKAGIDEIYSYDHDFDRLKKIKRLEP